MELLSRLHGTVSGSSGKQNGAVTTSIEHLFLYVNVFLSAMRRPEKKDTVLINFYFCRKIVHVRQKNSEIVEVKK